MSNIKTLQLDTRLWKHYLSSASFADGNYWTHLPPWARMHFCDTAAAFGEWWLRHLVDHSAAPPSVEWAMRLRYLCTVTLWRPRRWHEQIYSSNHIPQIWAEIMTLWTAYAIQSALRKFETTTGTIFEVHDQKDLNKINVNTVNKKGFQSNIEHFLVGPCMVDGG